MPSAKKKLLIAGGGYADIPLIEGAKRLGFYVISSGNRASDLGHPHADECRLVDFSDEMAILKLSQELRIDAICAGCNDFSAISAAYVAEKLGLPGHDSYVTTKLVHHKDSFRQFMHQHGLSSPRAEGFADIENAFDGVGERFELPVIVKPVDMTGGKGITIVTRPEKTRPALQTAFMTSRAKRIVVEEFVAGSPHGLSTFIRDSRVVFHFNDNEHYFRNPYLVSAASTPGNVPIPAVTKLCAEIERIAGLLALKDGIVHVQYILREEEPVIIEICRRAPGDLYVRFVEYATGVDYGARIVGAAAGLGSEGFTQVEPRGFFTRHCVMTEHRGKVRGVTFDPSIHGNVIEKFMWWKPGDQVEDVLTQKFGIVFLRFDSMDEMMTKTAQMQELICVQVTTTSDLV